MKAITTRAALKRLIAAVQAFSEERYCNGEDDKAMERAGNRVDRAMGVAMRHLNATAPKRKPNPSPIHGSCQEKP